MTHSGHRSRRNTAATREIGNRWGEAWALTSLGKAKDRGGRPDLAQRYWERALDIFDELGDPRAGELRTRLDRAARPA